MLATMGLGIYALCLNLTIVYCREADRHSALCNITVMVFTLLYSDNCAVSQFDSCANDLVIVLSYLCSVQQRAVWWEIVFTHISIRSVKLVIHVELVFLSWGSEAQVKSSK